MSLSYSSLIPPNLFILMAASGLVLALRWKRLGMVLAAIGTGCLYLAATPIVAYFLIQSAEALAGIIPGLPSTAPPGAIIVLAADFTRGNNPEETATVGPLTLERLAEAVRQQQRLGLPVLVSGGLAGPRSGTYARLMSTALKDEFRTSTRWREDRSSNTFENASFSAAMLRQAGVPAAIVVTHPWHMARALWSFRTVGYPAIPAPTPDGRALNLSAEAFLPQVPALLDSYHALHELIGLAWYRVAYGDG